MPSSPTRPDRVRPDVPVEVSLGLTPTVVAVAALALPIAVVAVALAAVIPAIPWWVGVVVAVVVGAVLVGQRMRNAHEHVRRELTGDAATITSVRLTNMVNGLALAAGVVEPEAIVVRDDAANATIAARNDSATIAVTSGLLERVEPVELEGVVAELLVRLRSGYAEASTLGAAVFRLPILGPLSTLLTGPAAAFGLKSLAHSGRDLQTDLEAVALTRYPPGLARALAKVQDVSNLPSGANPDLDDLWWVGLRQGVAGTEEAAGSLPRSPLDLRIDVLNEL